MTLGIDERPFAMTVVKHGSVGVTNSGVMITRAPWPAPTNKYYVLRKIIATQTTATGASGGSLAIWDQDLSNTSPVARGSAGGPLLTIPVTPLLGASTSGAGVVGGSATMTVLDLNACPREYFQAGVTCLPTISGAVNISLELDVV